MSGFGWDLLSSVSAVRAEVVENDNATAPCQHGDRQDDYPISIYHASLWLMECASATAT